ncbi:hypothetical protein [Acrocarpospora catenulata]|uniref:hypothetical protein n=1 Tax=Acrocarpospora catenulata TaxID=2836182 RepID=UPI001BDAA817|nr:hypothetical protein [Acrocarpospora catenulata]
MAWASPRAMLAGLCASALIPVGLAEPGLLAAAAGLNVVGSVGANVLATLISESLDAARIRTRRRSPADPTPADADAETSPDDAARPATDDDPDEEVFAERVRQELADRIEQMLATQDQQAQALAVTLTLVLERIDATTIVVGEVVSTGQHQLLRELMAGFAGLGDQVAGLGPLLHNLEQAVTQVQQSLARQDARHHFGRIQQQVMLDLLLESRQHLAELVNRLPDTDSRAGSGTEGRPLGWPLHEVNDPFALEVHHAIDSGADGLPLLPAYVRREHDRALGKVVAAAAAGTSRIAVLVGGSSTGKTRACWEALHPLRDQPQNQAPDRPWRLWHPIDPTRPDAALADLERIGPYTVVWLNEAQFYLADPALGEQVAAGLRELLRDPARGPVLVLATLWPAYWDTLTTRPGIGESDTHAQARELLDGHRIGVPDAFTGADLDALTGQATADPRLGQAAEHTRDGQITQYLAGGPVLLARYHDAPPATRALIHAAMDARRLGCGPHLPLALLADAAPGYLTDSQWEQTGDDWLQQALDHAATPANGISGILTPIKTRAPRNQRTSPATTPATQAGSGQMYPLADYLDQPGRHHRHDQIPPIHFWTSGAAHALPGDLKALGDAAWRRGLYRDAAQFYKNATAGGDPETAFHLVDRLHFLHPADHRPAHWAAIHLALADPAGVARLLGRLREIGATGPLSALLARDPATRVSLDAPYDVAALQNRLREVRAHEQLTVLAERAAAHVDLDNLYALTHLLGMLRKAGAHDQVTALAHRAAAEIALDDPDLAAALLYWLNEAGAHDQVAVLLARDPAARVTLDSPGSVGALLDRLNEAGAHEQVAALAERAVADLDDPYAVAALLGMLRKVGALDQVGALLARDPATRADLDEPSAVAALLGALWETAAHDQVRALLARDPAARVAIDNPYAVAALLGRLRAHEQLTALGERAAAHVDLGSPDALIRLLDTLKEAGAHEQYMALAERAAAHVALDDPFAADRLLRRLGEAGALGQAAVLADRLLAVGQLHHFLAISDHRKRFRFGREPDGSAAVPWTWDDLQ